MNILDSHSDSGRQSQQERNDAKEQSATLKIDTLEPRILLSATWVDADTGDPIGDATQGDDVFTGDNADDFADGLGGDDQLFGGVSDDTLFGGDGDDILHGENHADTLDGGDGDDQMFGGNHDDTLISGGGDDFMDGGRHDDTFQFAGAQDGDTITVDGGQHSDTIDLSEYTNDQINDDGSTINVDLGGGESFTINYSNVEAIETADGTYVPGDVPSNSAPDAVGETFTTSEDTPLTTGNVLDNDTDLDGDSLTVDSFTQPTNGSVVYNGDGTFTYTPGTNYNGSDSFTYTVSDGQGGTDTATVDLTVDTVNDPPEVGTPSPITEPDAPNGQPQLEAEEDDGKIDWSNDTDLRVLDPGPTGEGLDELLDATEELLESSFADDASSQLPLKVVGEFFGNGGHKEIRLPDSSEMSTTTYELQPLSVQRAAGGTISDRPTPGDLSSTEMSEPRQWDGDEGAASVASTPGGIGTYLWGLLRGVAGTRSSAERDGANTTRVDKNK